MSTPVPVRRLSAAQAAQQAIEVTRRQLFPFRLELWLPLGFLAFLDQCGRTGGGPPAPGGSGSSSGGAPDLGAAADWLGENVALVVIVAAVVIALVMGLTALVLWINSRGIFMYADAVSTGRSDIARPWAQHAEQAGSLFAWRFGLTVAGLLLLIVMGAVGVVLVFAVRDGRVAESEALGVGLLVLLPILLVAMLALSLVLVALRDFVAPLQMLHKTSCRPALETFLGILRGQPGVFVVYVLLKIVFAVAVVTASMVVGCVTCCFGFLPVVMQTLLQPAFYFERAWSLCLLRQAGHDVFAAGAPAGGGLDALRASPPEPSPLPPPPSP